MLIMVITLNDLFQLGLKKKKKQLRDCIIKAEFTVGAKKQYFQPLNLIIFCIHIQKQKFCALTE